MATNRIKELRERMEIKQEDLARRCGVKQSAVSAWEVGASTPRRPALEKLSEVFGVPIGYILGREDETYTPDISEIDFALNGAIRDLSDAEKQDLLDYVRFKQAQRSRGKS